MKFTDEVLKLLLDKISMLEQRIAYLEELQGLKE